jgi:hypothetical protein
MTLPKPEGPDLVLLSEIIMRQDALPLEQTIQIDMGTLGYVANERVAIGQEELTDESEHDKMVMMWIDAFTAGMSFAQAQAAQEPAIDAGNRRTRRTRRK